MKTGRWTAALLVLCLTGCVTRTLRIESDPPGAAVILDGDSVGTTPFETTFDWYGTREIILEMKGYESVTTLEEIAAPWWQYFPLDFLTDVLIPIPMEDRHVLRYTLKPFEHDDYDKTRQRALDAKKKADQEN